MNKKNTASLVFAALFMSALTTKASTLMQYEFGEVKASGSNMVSGTLAFISYGVDGLYNSLPSGLALNATSLVSGDDIWLYATSIANGTSQGNWQEQYTSAVAGQKFIAVFINSISNAQLNYTTGAFLGGLKIGSGAGSTSYGFGTYRTDSQETLGGSVADPASWVLPSNVGATASFIAYSNTGDYTGADLTASLSTTSSFSVIPEPSIASLLVISVIASMAVARKRSA